MCVLNMLIGLVPVPAKNFVNPHLGSGNSQLFAECTDKFLQRRKFYIFSVVFDPGMAVFFVLIIRANSS